MYHNERSTCVKICIIRGCVMELEIKKLTINLLDDWLNFFDNNAFSDDDNWPGCYCMHFHWNAGLDSRNNWNASLEQVYRKTGKADNRGHAIRYEYIEAYPLCHNRYGHIDFQGSVALFEKFGFEKSGHKMDDSFIVRKYLT